MRRVALVLGAMALALLLASGVAWAVNKIGTDGPDTLRGTNKADNLIGKGGNDVLFALAGRDNLLGGPGKDFVFGGTEDDRLSGGDKNLKGGPGNDIVVGGRGSDNVLGEAGNDFLIDGPTREFSLDKLSGGDGNDVFLVENVPAAKDIVTCGGGFDRVLADRKDVLASDCERVAVGLAAALELNEDLDERGFFERLFEEDLAPFPEGG